jgi:hypothetical protein
MKRPLLLIDVDGVISLFGFDPAQPPAGNFQIVDGIAHFLSAEAARHLLVLSECFETAWCTGWEEKANEYLPHALGLPGPWPYLEFGGPAVSGRGHWKLEAVERYTGPSRPVAWVDDGHDEYTQAWAESREAPTLLIRTDPSTGLTDGMCGELLEWAQGLAGAAGAEPAQGLATTENTGGSREATVDHEFPASADPNTSPEVAPK